MFKNVKGIYKQQVTDSLGVLESKQECDLKIYIWLTTTVFSTQAVKCLHAPVRGFKIRHWTFYVFSIIFNTSCAVQLLKQQIWCISHLQRSTNEAWWRQHHALEFIFLWVWRKSSTVLNIIQFLCNAFRRLPWSRRWKWILFFQQGSSRRSNKNKNGVIREKLEEGCGSDPRSLKTDFISSLFRRETQKLCWKVMCKIPASFYQRRINVEMTAKAASANYHFNIVNTRGGRIYLKYQ